MKDECDQALAKQWKIANEQLSFVRKSGDYLAIDFYRFIQAVKQAEDRLRASLELTHHDEKERLIQELIEKKNVGHFSSN
jgi:hypothetical protein